MNLNQKYKIGNLIYELRKKKGLSQVELGKLLNVTNKAISRWENGYGLPDVSLLLPLAKIFEITTDELLSGELKIASVEKTNETIKEINENIYSKTNKKIYNRYLLSLIPIGLAIIWFLFMLFYGHIFKLSYSEKWHVAFFIPFTISALIQTILFGFCITDFFSRKELKIYKKILISLIIFIIYVILPGPFFIFMTIGYKNKKLV